MNEENEPEVIQENNNQNINQKNGEKKDWLVTLLLCLFLGSIGVHRFYAGKIGTGILQVITVGGCGIWTLIDLIMIITGNFTDANGNKITND